MGVTRLMCAAQLKQCGLQPSIGQVNQLARERSLTPLQCGMKVAYYGCCCFVLGFVFKKCCFFLTIMDCVEYLSELLHEGWLLAFACKTGRLTQALLANKVAVRRIREAVLQACGRADTSPFDKALHNLWGANKQDLTKAASSITSALRAGGGGGLGCAARPNEEAIEDAIESVESKERGALQTVMRSLADLLRQNRPYLAQLEQDFV